MQSWFWCPSDLCGGSDSGENFLTFFFKGHIFSRIQLVNEGFGAVEAKVYRAAQNPTWCYSGTGLIVRFRDRTLYNGTRWGRLMLWGTAPTLHGWVNCTIKQVPLHYWFGRNLEVGADFRAIRAIWKEFPPKVARVLTKNPGFGGLGDRMTIATTTYFWQHGSKHCTLEP